MFVSQDSENPEPSTPFTQFSPLGEGIASWEALQHWREEVDASGKKIVMTNGCFDLLHAGHVRYLNQARALGDYLVVALNSDASTQALKGPGRPINPEADRAEVLLGLKAVDAVGVFDGARATEFIRMLKPHVYAKGGDYTLETLDPSERGALEGAGADIRILSLVEGKSTSKTLKKMASLEGKTRLKLGVLGSGRGSNFRSIVQAIENQQLDAEVAIVISDFAEAPILQFAREKGIHAVFVDPGPYKTKLGSSAQKEIRDRLVASGVDLVVLAGFMRLVKNPILTEYDGRIVNVHPSLLPKFKGIEAWKQALEAGEKEAGCTVHLVNEAMDEGPILAQAVVPVHADDTAETLHARIQVEEHRLLPEVIQRVFAAPNHPSA